GRLRIPLLTLIMWHQPTAQMSPYTTLFRSREEVRKPAVGADLVRIARAVEAQLDGFYDTAQGGWGRPQKYPLPAPVECELREARSEEYTSGFQSLTTLVWRRLLEKKRTRAL